MVAQDALITLQSRLQELGGDSSAERFPTELLQQHDPNQRYVNPNWSINTRVWDFYLLVIDVLVAHDTPSTP